MTLLTGALVNTWFLAGTLPALVRTAGEQVLLAIAAVLFCGHVSVVVMTAASGLYGRTSAAALRVLLCGAAGSLLLAPPLEPAYPASVYAPAEPYSAASVARGRALYDDNCVSCHGLSGRGDGPAALSLPIRPADLTEPHLFAHSAGELFFWISRGRANGTMPGFAAALAPNQRWDVINFIRARAAGVLVRKVSGEITGAGAYPVPEFAFEADGLQDTLRRMLEQGPALLVLYGPPTPLTRLRELAAVRRRLAAAGLQILAIELGNTADEATQGDSALPGLVVRVSGDVRATLALFQTPADGGETELMLDKNGNVRARWTAHGSKGLPDPESLIAAAAHAVHFAVDMPSHGHAH
jgi:putative copper resistance protein D